MVDGVVPAGERRDVDAVVGDRAPGAVMPGRDGGAALLVVDGVPRAVARCGEPGTGAEPLGVFDGGVESMTSRTRPVQAAMTITRPARKTAFLEPGTGQRVGSAEGLVPQRDRRADGVDAGVDRPGRPVAVRRAPQGPHGGG